MSRWQTLLQNSIVDPDALAARFNLDPEPLRQVAAEFPLRINPYFAGLIKQPGDPFWLQAIPDSRELQDSVCHEDPLNEEALSPVPNLIHKYPDRALFLVHGSCAMYCRFCTRKRKVGTPDMVVSTATIRAGLDYLSRTPEIRDVLLSGGDPLLLSDERLAWILTELRKIPSIQIIRIGTRVPCTLPMRVTARLAAMLRRFHPLYINTHFNHPDELTPQAAKACARLANAGIPMGCQTVLLKGVNDCPKIIRELMHRLLLARVKPYYIFQGDMTRGTDHFRTPLQTGLDIIRSLVGHTSGLAVPTFAVDAPGGGGKIPLLPEYVTARDEMLHFTNYRGRYCTYLDAV